MQQSEGQQLSLGECSEGNGVGGASLTARNDLLFCWGFSFFDCLFSLDAGYVVCLVLLNVVSYVSDIILFCKNILE